VPSRPVGGPKQRTNDTATIGTFQHGKDGKLTGKIHTLTLSASIEFVPAQAREGENKAPAFRLYTGTSEIGAAWERTSERAGKIYLSVKLDDPSFTAPIFATLTAREQDDGYVLIWSRQRS
jgi:uncharacterized protein (DUF736 family)